MLPLTFYVMFSVQQTLHMSLVVASALVYPRLQPAVSLKAMVGGFAWRCSARFHFTRLSRLSSSEEEQSMFLLVDILTYIGPRPAAIGGEVLSERLRLGSQPHMNP